MEKKRFYIVIQMEGKIKIAGLSILCHKSAIQPFVVQCYGEFRLSKEEWLAQMKAL